MENILLREDMIEQIEKICTMSKNEFYETYEKIIDTVIFRADLKNIKYIKLELLYLIYEAFYEIYPDIPEKNRVNRHFNRLEMEEILKKYQHSESMQKIIKKIYCNLI